MKIGISGASGKLGAATVAALKLHAPDAQLVGISRSPDKVSALGIEARFGDFDQPDSLTTAFAGLERLLIIPSGDMRPGVRATQGHDAIQRAVDAGVGHVVFTSALGTRSAEIPHLWQSYFVPEQTLMRLAKKWTILRMAYYAEAFIDEVRMSLPGGVHAATSNTPVNFVARDDVAAVGHQDQLVPRAGRGPAREVVDLGRVAADEVGLLDAVLGIQDMWSVGGFDVTTGDVERLAGRPPQSLEDALRSTQL